MDVADRGTDAQLDVRPGTHLTYVLAKAQHRLEMAINRALEPEGLTLRQFSAMAHIASTPRLRAADLARLLLVSPQAAGTLVQRLLGAGLVARAGGGGASGGRLRLTELGLARLRSAERVATRAEEQALGVLSPEVRRCVDTALAVLLDV